MRRMIIGAIRVWQLVVSPWLPPACRYEPSCSEYGVVAVRRFGAIRGSWLCIRRLLRCRPLGPHGYDPVPPREH